MKRRIVTLCLTGMLLLSACGGGRQEAPQADASGAEASVATTDTSQEDADEDTPLVIESTDLQYFSAVFVDDAAADGAGYAYLLRQRSDGSQADVSVTAIPLAEGYEAVTAETIIDASALAALQEVIASTDLISAYCTSRADGDEIEEDYGQTERSRMTLVYASGEEAHHESDGACLVDAATQAKVKDFFYGLLREEGIRFYGMDNTYNDEEYLDVFLAQAPFDEIVTEDGTTLALSFGEGRVFDLAINGETAAGNYKRRVQTAEGSRGTDTLTVTLTTWPADWEQMMNGGSFIVEKLTVEKGMTAGTGTETVTIHKNGTAFSLFDPYFGEDGTLTFTRNYTGFFEESMGEEAQETEETDE